MHICQDYVCEFGCLVVTFTLQLSAELTDAVAGTIIVILL